MAEDSYTAPRSDQVNFETQEYEPDRYDTVDLQFQHEIEQFFLQDLTHDTIGIGHDTSQGVGLQREIQQPIGIPSTIQHYLLTDVGYGVGLGHNTTQEIDLLNNLVTPIQLDSPVSSELRMSRDLMEGLEVGSEIFSASLTQVSSPLGIGHDTGLGLANMLLDLGLEGRFGIGIGHDMSTASEISYDMSFPVRLGSEVESPVLTQVYDGVGLHNIEENEISLVENPTSPLGVGIHSHTIIDYARGLETGIGLASRDMGAHLTTPSSPLGIGHNIGIIIGFLRGLERSVGVGNRSAAIIDYTRGFSQPLGLGHNMLSARYAEPLNGIGLGNLVPSIIELYRYMEHPMGVGSSTHGIIDYQRQFDQGIGLPSEVWRRLFKPITNSIDNPWDKMEEKRTEHRPPEVHYGVDTSEQEEALQGEYADEPETARAGTRYQTFTRLYNTLETDENEQRVVGELETFIQDPDRVDELDVSIVSNVEAEVKLENLSTRHDSITFDIVVDYSEIDVETIESEIEVMYSSIEGPNRLGNEDGIAANIENEGDVESEWGGRGGDYKEQKTDFKSIHLADAFVPEGSDEFRVPIDIYDMGPIHGYDITIEFDSSVLTFKRAEGYSYSVGGQEISTMGAPDIEMVNNILGDLHIVRKIEDGYDPSLYNNTSRVVELVFEPEDPELFDEGETEIEIDVEESDQLDPGGQPRGVKEHNMSGCRVEVGEGIAVSDMKTYIGDAVENNVFSTIASVSSSSIGDFSLDVEYPSNFIDMVESAKIRQLGADSQSTIEDIPANYIHQPLGVGDWVEAEMNGDLVSEPDETVEYGNEGSRTLSVSRVSGSGSGEGSIDFMFQYEQDKVNEPLEDIDAGKSYIEGRDIKTKNGQLQTEVINNEFGKVIQEEEIQYFPIIIEREVRIGGILTEGVDELDASITSNTNPNAEVEIQDWEVVDERTLDVTWEVFIGEHDSQYFPVQYSVMPIITWEIGYESGSGTGGMFISSTRASMSTSQNGVGSGFSFPSEGLSSR